MDKRKEYERLYAKFDAQLAKACANCDKTEDLTIHHVVPLANGGNNVISNLRRLCSECHAAAHGGMSFIKNFRQSVKDNVENGRRNLGSLPLGYDSIDGEIIVNEEEADVVRYIYHLRYETEMSVSKIPIVLNAMAFPTKRNAGKWSHVAVMKILKNPMYYGNYVFKGVDYGKKITPILGDDTAQNITRFNEKYANKRMTTKCKITVDGVEI